MLKIYNSLTKRKEPFSPQRKGMVKMYTCGVTVYDQCHIGHARSLYVFEVIRRYLKYRGYKVKFVRNITDIDDKIINRAKELGVSWKELSGRYIAAYYRDLKSLGIGAADKEPKATDNIKDMIKYIKRLIDKGYAYVTDSGAYFSVRKFSGYGKLSGQSIDQMQDGVRVTKDETKKDFLDFALWKRSKAGEPSWPSPWGRGRPGWHIECSVMSQKFLKTDSLDIHGGGRDLIFPHHENERAQSEVLTGKIFASYWLHHGLLTINNQKMSKSLGNSLTVEEALAKYPADILKIFYLQAHYSSSIDFSAAKMEEVKKAYQRIKIFIDRVNPVRSTEATGGKSKISNGVNYDDFQKKQTKEIGQLVADLREKFVAAMDDDFNMPKGLAVLFDIVTIGNKYLERGSEAGAEANAIKNLVREILDIFAIGFKIKRSMRMERGDIERLIAQRAQLKANKQYQKADKIRKELGEQGIILEDTKEGTAWRNRL